MYGVDEDDVIAVVEKPLELEDDDLRRFLFATMIVTVTIVARKASPPKVIIAVRRSF